MLGCSSGFFWKTHLTYEQKIERILELQHDAIEIGLGYKAHLTKPFSPRAVDLVKQFTYRSIHAPSDTRYPSAEGEAIIEQILDYAKRIKAHTVVLHPDRVDDFSWINQRLGSLLAFENMDYRKTFGRTVKDMEAVFRRSPKARFVCDLNHIFTWDETMRAAAEFHSAFADRLCHYHLSGYGGDGHQCLSITHEDVIISAVSNAATPIILESVPEADTPSLPTECLYVRQRLST